MIKKLSSQREKRIKLINFYLTKTLYYNNIIVSLIDIITSMNTNIVYLYLLELYYKIKNE